MKEFWENIKGNGEPYYVVFANIIFYCSIALVITVICWFIKSVF